MAVMHKMRENMQVILFFLLIMFLASMTIGGLVGGANILDLLTGKKKDTVMVVNEQQISYDQYNQARQNQLENYRQQNNQEPTGYQLQQFETQLYQGIIVDVLKQQAVQELGLNATNDEVKYFMLTNPHPIITMDQNFQNDKGEFDPSKYQAALSNPEADNFWMYKEQQLRMFLPYEKLERELKSTIRITDAELKDEYKKKNEKVKVKYIAFENSKYTIADNQISDDEIKTYYHKHSTEFKNDEQRKIRFALFSNQASAKDSSDVRDQVLALLDSTKHGSDFAKLAELYSDDPGSASKGGDLGFFGRNAMVKPFEDAAFAAKKGDIVGPIETVNGLHIIKIEDKRVENNEEQVSARHILLKFKASRDTEDAAREQADYFEKEAADNGFASAAVLNKVKIDSTTYFQINGFIPGLGVQERVATRAFHQKPGVVSKVYFIDGRGYVVFEVSGIKPAAIQPLEEVKARILTQLRKDKQLVRAKADAEALRAKTATPEQFESAAASQALTVKETDFFTIDGYIPAIGRDPKFTGAAFNLKPYELSQPVEGAQGYYLLLGVARQEYDAKLFVANKDNLKKDAMQRKLQMVYSDWLANMKAKSKIDDLRYKFY
jgi:peptidyl-prolyl cis-trans isomerase D